jgi:hypothetical protein
VTEKHDQIACIREAARLMRQRAEAATPGPWGLEGSRSIVGPEGMKPKLAGHVVCSVGAYDRGVPSEADAEHIASWHPGVALAVAALLNSLADLYAAGIAEPQPLPLAIVRAYLGEVDHG